MAFEKEMENQELIVCRQSQTTIYSNAEKIYSIADILSKITNNPKDKGSIESVQVDENLRLKKIGSDLPPDIQKRFAQYLKNNNLEGCKGVKDQNENLLNKTYRHHEHKYFGSISCLQMIQMTQRNLAQGPLLPSDTRLKEAKVFGGKNKEGYSVKLVYQDKTLDVTAILEEITGLPSTKRPLKNIRVDQQLRLQKVSSHLPKNIQEMFLQYLADHYYFECKMLGEGPLSKQIFCVEMLQRMVRNPQAPRSSGGKGSRRGY